MTRSDRNLILVTGGAVVLAGLLFAAVIAFATGTSDPAGKPEGPLYIGPKRDLLLTLDEGTGSPLYFANPFGGRGFWLDRENGELTALDVGRWGDVDCSIRWRGRINSYVDCTGERLTKDQLARYDVIEVTIGKRKGGVFVDLASRSAPPSPS